MKVLALKAMRGKEERARSGKIPQGTGKGCYGYTYNKETGQREVSIPERDYGNHSNSQRFC